jgi:transcriptional regulator with XRE-family HTH domain
MNENFFALRLSQLREQKGYTARDMSLSIGQSESYINKIENKRIQPSFENFYAICDHLGITPKDFFDEGNSYPERLNGVIKNMRKLDDKALGQIASLVETLVEKTT